MRYLPSGIVPDWSGGSLVLCDIATVQFDETQDRILDLSELLARAVFHRQVEQQVAVLDIRLPSALTLAHPCRSEHDAAPIQPFVQALAQFAKSLPSGSSPTSVRLQWIVRCATKGRPINLANATASMMLVAWRMLMYLLARLCFLGFCSFTALRFRHARQCR